MRAGTWILVMLFAAAAASAAQLYRALSAERARAGALEARVAALERQPSLLPAPTALPAPPPPAAAPAASAPAAKPPAPPPAQAAAPARDGEFRWSSTPSSGPDAEAMRRARERQAALWKDPEYRAAMVAQRKLGIGRMYDELGNELGLSPQDRDRLVTMLAEHQIPDPENLQPWGGGPPPDEAQAREWRERAQARQRAQQDELRGLLGDAGYSRYREYEQTLGARMQARQVGESLASSGMPLREDQERALVKIYADEQQRMMEEFRRASPTTPPPATQVPGAPPPVRTSGIAPAAAPVQGASPSQALAPSEDERRRWRERQLAAQEASVKRMRDAAASVLSPEQLDRVMQQQEANLAMLRATIKLEK